MVAEKWGLGDSLRGGGKESTLHAACRRLSSYALAVLAQGLDHTPLSPALAPPIGRDFTVRQLSRPSSCAVSAQQENVRLIKKADAILASRIALRGNRLFWRTRSSSTLSPSSSSLLTRDDVARCVRLSHWQTSERAELRKGDTLGASECRCMALPAYEPGEQPLAVLLAPSNPSFPLLLPRRPRPARDALSSSPVPRTVLTVVAQRPATLTRRRRRQRSNAAASSVLHARGERLVLHQALCHMLVGVQYVLWL